MRSLEAFVLVFGIGMVAFGFGEGHDGLELLDAFADGVDGVAALLEVGGEVVVEVHVNVVKTVFPSHGLLETPHAGASRRLRRMDGKNARKRGTFS